MEHGLQTHSLPQSQEKMALLARRCGYQEPDSFERDLQHHCQQVNAIYQRVFDPSILEKPKASRLPPLATRATNLTLPIEIVSADRVNIDRLFQESLTALTALPTIETDQADIANAIISGLQSSINVARSLRRLRDFALSAASDSAIKEAGKLSAEQIREFTIISGASHYFSQILISNPRLIRLLGGPLESALTNINSSAMIDLFTEQLRGVDFDEAGMRLRRCWHEQIIKIGRFDLLQPTTIDNEQSLRALTQINRAQTALAEASLAAACQLAGESAAQRYERADAPLIYTILGLGRLGHCGLDYNSDLDIVFIYSEASGDVAKQATNQEFYARMAEIVIQILSTLTREGALYRVDLRLRPDGRNGLLATSYDKLQQYISERAAIWELMAYLKLRPVAGDATFGQQIYDRVLELIFARARACATTLADEVKEMRNRLQVEKAGVDDYKFGIGGMLDVYFATRYLQLRHSKPDPAERGTMALINYLGNIELLSPEQTKKLKAGYGFLRRLDHETRLQLERPKSTLPHNQAQLLDLARRLGFANAEDLLSAYRQHRDAIRTTYQQIVDSEN
jgi:glutamate-ammonia-ligase adenylyltransferase